MALRCCREPEDLTITMPEAMMTTTDETADPGLMRADRRGFTLPMVVLLVALLSIALVLGFTRTSAELRSFSDQQAAMDAAALAQTGMARYLANLSALPASGSFDTTISGLPGGSAAVSLRRVRDSAATAGDVWVAYATGTATSASRLGAGVPVASRSFAQVLTPPTGSTQMNVLAAWTSLNGMTTSGGNHDGADASHAAGYPNNVNPVATIAGGYSGTATLNNPSTVGNLGTVAAAYGATHIDWNGIVNGGAITPDYVRSNCSGSWPSTPAYPVILVTGNCNITTAIDWRGSLIVTGNLTTTSSLQIHGVVLAGGNFNTTGSPQIWGTVISGLNRGVPSMTPQPVGADISSGNPQYWYSSTDIRSAMARLVPSSTTTALVLTRNAWLDNWPSY